MITIPIEISSRHAHFSAADWTALFGTPGPTKDRDLSQRPQFLAVERVSLSGPGGILDRVGIVGPCRSATQIELAASDARRLGVAAPVRASGQIQGAAPITVTGPSGSITVPAAIIQRRHIHASPEAASRAGLHDGQLVSLRVLGERGGMFHGVLVRVDPTFSWNAHLDTDEANAFGIRPGAEGEIIV